MGTWGDGPFDDDGASDWVYELEAAADWRVIETALLQAADVSSDAYLEADVGQRAWAAAAVVAAVDDPTIALPDEVSAWLTRFRDTRPEDLCALGLKALRRVLGSKSELAELWRESGEETTWRANVEKIAAKLGGASGSGEETEPGSAEDTRVEESSAEEDERAATALVEEGLELGRQGLNEEAVAIFNRVEEGFGTSPQPAVRVQVARALLAKGIALAEHVHPYEAIKVFDLVLKRYQGSPDLESRVIVAKAMIGDGHNVNRLTGDSGMSFYDMVVDDFGDAPEPALQGEVARALIVKVLALSRLNRPDDAIAVHDLAVKRFRDAQDPAVRTLVGELFAHVAESFDQAPEPALRALAQRARTAAESFVVEPPAG
jgi:hypothetical protein